MRNKSIYMLSLLVLLAACGGQEEGLEEKKGQLTELKAQVKELNSKISELEKEIASEDTSFASNKTATRNAVLVTTLPVDKNNFQHKTEVRGSVESRKNVMLTPEISGKIKSIQVEEGQRVSANQVLMTLNADVLRNTKRELETSLELAEAVYKRQKNLWDKNIGTEIQYLEAKNKKESLESKLATTNSQIAQSVIRAPFSGVIDNIPAKVGEVAGPGSQLVRIVNPDAMYIKADVSERFLGSFSKGDAVEIYFPSQGKELSSTVASVSGVIDQNNRTFTIEVKLPKVDFVVKPNQVTVLKLVDYSNNSAITVPTRIIQEDQKGTYVYVADNKSAKKVHITTGVTYEGRTEILAGLMGSEELIDKGVRELTDGTSIKVSKESAELASN